MMSPFPLSPRLTTGTDSPLSRVSHDAPVWVDTPVTVTLAAEAFEVQRLLMALVIPRELRVAYMGERAVTGRATRPKP